MPVKKENINRVKELIDWAREDQGEPSQLFEALFQEARRRWGHSIRSPMPAYVKRAFLTIRYNSH